MKKLFTSLQTQIDGDQFDLLVHENPVRELNLHYSKRNSDGKNYANKYYS